MRVTLFSVVLVCGIVSLVGCRRAPTPAPAVPVGTAAPTANETAQSDKANDDTQRFAAKPTANIVDGTLANPIRLKAGGQFVDTETGHAAPYIADIDRDGKLDLLVGQFGQGKLKICRNIGSNKAPKYALPTFFEAGGEIVTTGAG